MGVVVGNLLAAGVFAVVGLLPRQEFLAWGWRLPFLISIVLIAFGLYIRARIAETPVFSEVTGRREPIRLPVIEAIRRHPRSFQGRCGDGDIDSITCGATASGGSPVQRTSNRCYPGTVLPEADA